MLKSSTAEPPTPAQIRALDGDELATAVAEHFLGFRRRTGWGWDYDGVQEESTVLIPPDISDEGLKYYSMPAKGKIPLTFFVPLHVVKDIRVAWERVVGPLVARGWGVAIVSPKAENSRTNWTVTLDHPEKPFVHAFGSRVEVALCRAAVISAFVHF